MFGNLKRKMNYLFKINEINNKLFNDHKQTIINTIRHQTHLIHTLCHEQYENEVIKNNI